MSWLFLSLVAAASLATTDALTKRTSLLFGVLYGIFWFKEGHLPERLVAALLMMAGVFLIGWNG